MKIFALLFFLSMSPILAFAQEKPVLDILLTNYEYPFPVEFLDLHNQNLDLKMAYMDVKPTKPNGKVVVLLHGKNFNGAYWETTTNALLSEGYRVIIPDQIGFGKSSKPVEYQFTVQQLAQNTDALLQFLKIDEIYLLGHSMGGMVATRYTLMYPEKVKKLILENPIGLEDWKLVAPYTSIQENYKKELKVDYQTTRKYQEVFYYDNQWKPEYDEWVYLLTGWVKSTDYPQVAMVNAKTSDMIFTQPVVYEFEKLNLPTLLIIGTRDRTAIGKNTVKDPEIAAKMGQYQLLGKATQQKIKNSELVELDQIGHLPHIEVFDRFITPLKQFLNQ